MADDFDKKTVKKFGARGSPVFEQEQKTTDLEELQEEVEETALPFCNCGAPITAKPDVYRCCDCELICCQRCQITHSRKHYCPMCAKNKFDLDKRTFLSLVFIQHDLMPPDALVDITTQAGEVVEIAIDATADAVLLNDYLTDDGTLSPQGSEALHVGHQLYGEDPDVESLMNQLQVQEVVERP